MDPAKAGDEERAWQAQHQVVLLQAELDLLEEWALRHCHKHVSDSIWGIRGWGFLQRVT